MRNGLRTIAAVAGLSLAASTAQAQSFTGSGCAGDTFEFCALWTGTLIDATHFQFFITNTSGAAPANNPGSFWTQIAIGNVTIADPTSMAAVTGWQYDANINGFNGFGLLENQFGSITTNGINNALGAGDSRTFTFALSGALTAGEFNTAFAGVQVGIHDQGSPQGCASAKGVLDGNSSDQDLFEGDCGITTTTPEPASVLLMATGLVGLFAFTRRRRLAV
jgi:hypothetical protein